MQIFSFIEPGRGYLSIEIQDDGRIAVTVLGTHAPSASMTLPRDELAALTGALAQLIDAVVIARESR